MEINKVSIYLLFMDLLVAYKNDPAGHNMAKFISQNMNDDGDIYRGKNFDLIEIDSPAISADWLDEKYEYDGFIFLSKHAAESGTLALTCHSTGNFDEAKFGGNQKELAIPYPDLQKRYMQKLWDNHESFPDFEITIEATHHGPTSLRKPSIFIEIGPSMNEWVNENAAELVSKSLWKSCSRISKSDKVAIGFGGPHYSEKFTKFIVESEFSLASVASKYNLQYIDKEMVIQMKNKSIEPVRYAALDWKGLGKEKKRIIDVINELELEVIRI